ncbi:hypothetical protein [Enterobacter asburiae]|uniref:hypothetical protein n=1 Tax=Enterobacter asburiae TaxID=61645 RepID=UPI0011D29402|nr:hypothetical protein [Enterobacter asburiae]
MNKNLESSDDFLSNSVIREYSFRNGNTLSQYDLISSDGTTVIENNMLIAKKWDRITLTNLTPDATVIMTLRNATCSGHCFVNPNSVQFITFGPVQNEDATVIVPVNRAGHINIDIPPVSDLTFSGYRLIINELSLKSPITKNDISAFQKILNGLLA